jgi:L-amino acid N-acyltransferase YncA
MAAPPDQQKAVIRPALPADMAGVLAIYTPEVLHGVATFEEIPPSLEEMLRRRETVLAAGLPYLVAEGKGRILGYSYATAFRPRPAYRFTIENSVYVAADAHRRGIGRLLLTALIRQCEAGPWRQMVAVIGDSANAGSIGLHQTLGFRDAGVLEAVGFKFGRWIDTVQMQLPLGEGSGTQPTQETGGAER